MRSSLVILAVLVSLSSCNGCGKGTSAVDAAPASADAQRAAATPAPLSLPIAAAVTSDGAVLVAGLVAAKHTVVVERHDADGVTWVADAATNVDWTPDLELRVLADASSGGGVVVRSAATRQLRLVDKDGNLGPTSTPGAALCATEKGIAQVDSDGSVVLRGWSGGELGRSAGLADRDPVLVCAQNDVFVLAEGEDDVMVLRVPQRGLPLKLAYDTDDVRERAPFTSGDMLGLAMVTQSGSTRIVRVTDGVSATYRMKKQLSEDDDLESVDGDDKVTYVALSHDASDRCTTGGAATDVSVVRIDDEESEIDVVKGDCGKDLGPYHVDATSKGAVLAWAERAPKRAHTDPPIERIAWAKIGDAANVSSAAVRGEGIAFAGCAKDRCHIAVLERPPGTDGMTPGTVRIISYP